MPAAVVAATFREETGVTQLLSKLNQLDVEGEKIPSYIRIQLLDALMLSIPRRDKEDRKVSRLAEAVIFLCRRI